MKTGKPYKDSNYTVIRSIVDPHYGEARLLQEKATKEQFCELIQIFSTENELEQARQVAERKFTQPHKNVMTLANFDAQTTLNMCAKVNKLKLLYEYCGNSLQQEIKTRTSQKQDSSFSILELYAFLYSILSGLYYYRDIMQQYHGDIRPETVFIYQSGLVKISEKLSQIKPTTAYQQLLLGQRTDYNISPEYFYQLGQASLQPQGDQEKNDVFALGILMMKSALLTTDLQDIYDTNDYSIRLDAINEKLDTIQLKYPGPLAALLGQMLAIDPSDRLNFQQIQETLIEIVQNHDAEAMASQSQVEAQPVAVTATYNTNSAVQSQTARPRTQRMVTFDTQPYLPPQTQIPQIYSTVPLQTPTEPYMMPSDAILSQRKAMPHHKLPSFLIPTSQTVYAATDSYRPQSVQVKTTSHTTYPYSIEPKPLSHIEQLDQQSLTQQPSIQQSTLPQSYTTQSFQQNNIPLNISLPQIDSNTTSNSIPIPITPLSSWPISTTLKESEQFVYKSPNESSLTDPYVLPTKNSYAQPITENYSFAATGTSAVPSTENFYSSSSYLTPKDTWIQELPTKYTVNDVSSIPQVSTYVPPAMSEPNYTSAYETSTMNYWNSKTPVSSDYERSTSESTRDELLLLNEEFANLILALEQRIKQSLNESRQIVKTYGGDAAF